MNIGSTSGDTALMFAAQKGQLTCVKALIAAGAEINLENFWAPRALDMEGHPQCLEALILARADLKHMNYNNESSLFLACRGSLDVGKKTCVKLLLQHGARINNCLNHQFLNSRCRRRRTFTERQISLHADVYLLLFAAGQAVMCPAIFDFSQSETCMPERVCACWNQSEHGILSLQDACRLAIRQKLLKVAPQENLFVQIPRLGLPTPINKYLLYDVSLTTKDERISSPKICRRACQGKEMNLSK